MSLLSTSPAETAAAVTDRNACSLERQWQTPIIGTLLLGLFTFCEPLFHRLASMRSFSYDAPVMALELLQSPRGLASAALGVILVAASWKRDWSGPAPTAKAARMVVSACSLCIAWAYCAYSYNFVYEQYHIADRILLVALAIGVCFRPAFIGLFAIAFTVCIGQFQGPMFFSWTDKMPVIQTIYLMTCFQAVRMTYRRADFGPFVFAIIAMWAAFYFAAGLAKLRIGWFMENVPGNIIYGAHIQNGWLSNLPWSTIANLAKTADSFGWILKVFVIVTEVGAAFILFHRNLCLAFFAAAALLHVGIFATTGILFWKWIVIDLVWLVVVYRCMASKSHSLFSFRAGLIGLIACSLFIAFSKRDIWLGWFDSRVVYSFEVVAADEHDHQWTVPPYLLAPYDMPLAQGRFYFLTKTPQVVNCFGSVKSHRALVETAIFTDSPADPPAALAHLRNQLGIQRTDATREAQLEAFFRKYIRAHNQQRTCPRYWFAVPQHIWSNQPIYSQLDPLPREAKINRVSVILREFVTRNENVEMIHEELVLTVGNREDAGEISSGLDQ